MLHLEPTVRRKSKSFRDRYALYLVRKPIEITPEDLTIANIPLEDCAKSEEIVTIGNNEFVVRGAGLPTQTFHIPSSTLHASEAAASTEAVGKVTGSVVISRAEFDLVDGVFEEGNDVPLDLIQHLPLKPIKKKVSRKGIKRLRQRLSATGVKKLKTSDIAIVEEDL
ncbi:unnamed protein product [Strongylus vulgaris]|uniref:Uncharacterized protein n=1 Tax=Strongylus vulgaris TaxID=40348 RepID=A0A3P7IQW3_STRVU|nr:unnamed protein product [Strongylus vulgaris]